MGKQLRDIMNETVKPHPKKKLKPCTDVLVGLASELSARKAQYTSLLSGNWNAEVKAAAAGTKRKRKLNQNSVPENDASSSNTERPKKKRRLSAGPCANSTMKSPGVKIVLTHSTKAEKRNKRKTLKAKFNAKAKANSRAVLDDLLASVIDNSRRAQHSEYFRARNDGPGVIDLTIDPVFPRARLRQSMHCSNYVEDSSPIVVDDEETPPRRKNAANFNETIVIDDSVVELEPRNIYDDASIVYIEDSPKPTSDLVVSNPATANTAPCTITKDDQVQGDISIVFLEDRRKSYKVVEPATSAASSAACSPTKAPLNASGSKCTLDKDIIPLVFLEDRPKANGDKVVPEQATTSTVSSTVTKASANVDPAKQLPQPTEDLCVVGCYDSSEITVLCEKKNISPRRRFNETIAISVNRDPSANRIVNSYYDPISKKSSPPKKSPHQDNAQANPPKKGRWDQMPRAIANVMPLQVNQHGMEQLRSLMPVQTVQHWQPYAHLHRMQTYGNNYSTPPKTPTAGLRPIVIDGSNVAMGHGRPGYFSSRGLQICVDFFVKKHHKVYAFVPLHRRSAHDTLDPQILNELERAGHLIFTPSRKVDGRRITPYDDRYIVQTAATNGGVIVSKDNYRDLLEENPNYADVIKNRLLMFTWVEDMIMFPPDPLGQRGPTLDQLLRF